MLSVSFRPALSLLQKWHKTSSLSNLSSLFCVSAKQRSASCVFTAVYSPDTGKTEWEMKPENYDYVQVSKVGRRVAKQAW